MKVKITSDSTCDLSPELIEKYDIAITPLSVHCGDQVGHDGVEITPETIYDYVDASGQLPRTSAVNVFDYVREFRSWRQQGYSVVHFCISSDFSSSYQNACMAAADVGDVYVVDSRNLSTGQGLLVLHGAELAAAGTEECDPKKLRIKEWLRAHGKTRRWLAEQCRVSVRTVHTWFTARGNIPVTQYLFIDKLMNEGESWKVQLPNTIPVNFPETEMEIVHKFQELHPDIDLPMYGMHKVLELCVNVLTQDEYSKASPYFRITNTGEICHRRIK